MNDKRKRDLDLYIWFLTYVLSLLVGIFNYSTCRTEFCGLLWYLLSKCLKPILHFTLCGLCWIQKSTGSYNEKTLISSLIITVIA